MTRAGFTWALLVVTALTSHVFIKHAACQSSIVDALNAAGLTALAGAVNRTGADLTGFTAATLPEDLQLVQVLQYHLLTTTALPSYNDTTAPGGIDQLEPSPDSTPGWPTALDGYNVSIVAADPAAHGGDTPYYFYSYADQPAKTNSSQCVSVATSDSTNATLCVVDSVLIPVPANDTIVNYVINQPNLSIITAAVSGIPMLVEALSSPDVVATLFVPTDAAMSAYIAKLAERNITTSDNETFGQALILTLGGHLGASLVPFSNDGTGSTTLYTAVNTMLVANASGVTSILANGTETGPVPLVNGTRVGKSFVYTIETVLETGAADTVLAGNSSTPAPAVSPAPGNSTTSPAPSPSDSTMSPAPSPSDSTMSPAPSPSDSTLSPAPSPSVPRPSPSPSSAPSAAWMQGPLLVAAALLALLL